MSPSMTLAMYREAFEHHVEKCDHCSWLTLQLCHVGVKLRDAYSQACAALMVPIPTISRAKVKA